MADVDDANRAGGGTLPKVVSILEFFAEHGVEWRIRELAEQLGMSRSTVHRICQMLVAEDMLTFDAETEQYSWGPSLTRISLAVARSVDVSGFIHGVIEDLVAELDETVARTLYDPARRQLVFVDVVECRQPVRYHIETGVAMPVHAGASGKAVLAFLPDAVVDDILDAGLDALTDRTVTDTAAMRRDLDRIRRDGHAVSHGERTIEAVGIACPTFDAHGAVTGSVIVTIPEYRFDADRQTHIVARLTAAAAAITRLAT